MKKPVAIKQITTGVFPGIGMANHPDAQSKLSCELLSVLADPEAIELTRFVALPPGGRDVPKTRDSDTDKLSFKVFQV